MKKRYLFSAAAAILLLFLCGTHVYAGNSWVSPQGGYERKLLGNGFVVLYKPQVYHETTRICNTWVIKIKDPDGAVVLNEETDYYSLNEAVVASLTPDKTGTYTITAQCYWYDSAGIHYSETDSAVLEVYPPKDISEATITVKDQPYDPFDFPEPEVTVTMDGQVLQRGTDYDIWETYGRTSIGTDEVTIEGRGDYTGRAKGTYEILPLDLSGTAKVSAEDQYQDYTGEVMRPEIVVEADGCPKLEEGRDYEITGYSNNTKPGIASVKVRFIGNYTGTKEAAFEVIRKYDLNVGGVQVTNKNAANITGDGISGKVSYDAASRTLSLSNASISDCYSISHGYAGTDTYSIYGSDLTIRLSGSNSMAHCISAGTLKIKGKGSLSLAGRSGLPTSTALKCNSLLVSKESVFTITKASTSYGSCAAEISGKLDVRGTMHASVPSGAPATGIRCGTADVSGKLHITVKSAYTNFACGIYANSLTISGEALIDTSGAKDDAGIRASGLTVKSSGSLTVLSRKAAARTDKLVLGNTLVLLAGDSKASAVEITPSVEALEEHTYISTLSVPKAGTKLTHSGSGLIYAVSKRGKEVSLKGDSKKKKTVKVPQTVTLKGIKYKVTAISSNAFKDSTKLQEITLGNKITKIGDKAFSGCKSLKKVVIPSSVKSVGKEAFLNCKKLTAVTIKTTKLTSRNVGKNAFKGISSKAILTVPSKVKKAYKAILQKKGLPTGAKIKS